MEEPDIPPITSTRYVDESDPDIIYQSTSTANSKKADDVVTIGVHDLVLNDRCNVFDDDDYEKVFVSVEFLNYQEELETPLSLIKGEPNKKLSFNFQKGLHIDFSRNKNPNLISFFSFLQSDCLVRDQKAKQDLAEFVGPSSSGEYVYRSLGLLRLLIFFVY